MKRTMYKIGLGWSLSSVFTSLLLEIFVGEDLGIIGIPALIIGLMLMSIKD